jgi:hypothetical protein
MRVINLANTAADAADDNLYLAWLAHKFKTSYMQLCIQQSHTNKQNHTHCNLQAGIIIALIIGSSPSSKFTRSTRL